MPNTLLAQAIHKHRLASRQGLLERLFTLMFRGFVYPQIWEDPEVDLQALAIGPDSRIVTIASGGCNILNYLTEGPAHITAVDLNPAHIALTRLKLAALAHLPDHESFFRFFGHADEKGNLRAYRRHISPHLDAGTRRYWEQRRLGGRRIGFFARNLYRYGLLGRFIGTVHVLARLHGQNPRRILAARSVEEQRWLFDNTIGPIFETRLVKALCRMPVSLYGLGIPPAQYQALAGSANGDMAGLLRDRLKRLACDFPIDDNYFAWQAFGRGYDRERRRAVPRYLDRRHYEGLRGRLDRVSVRHASVTEHLAGEPDASIDRYVLLDAQDWMNAGDLAALWTEIRRTARPGARVIFRTAGEESCLPGKLPEAMLAEWEHDPARCRDWAARDRSSIYGGFHLYVLKG